MRIAGTLTSTGGLSAQVGSRFQVGRCQGLGFSPKLSFSLTGRGRTRSGDHPNLTATLNQGAGQANIRSAKVALPLSLVPGIRFGKGGQRIHTLPSLLIPLRGQIAIDLRASSAVNGAQQLVTTFSTIPDAPVSKFTLDITGGPKGILVITGRGQTICGKAQVASAQFGAQPGTSEAPNPRLATPACARYHARRHVRRHAAHRARTRWDADRGPPG